MGRLRRRTLLTLALLALASCGAARTDAGPEPLEEPFRLLLLGDSISMGYTPIVAELLEGRAVVCRARRPDGERQENCAGTTHGVEHLERWLGQEGGPWDVIHFNFGLHDLKRVDAESGKNSNDPDDPQQAAPEVYERQLRAITERLVSTGARLVFATTTPVPEGVRPYRAPSDPVEYNAIARRVMAEHGVAIDDLYALTVERLDELQNEADVHFHADGSRVLAEGVVASVLRVAGLER